MAIAFDRSFGDRLRVRRWAHDKPRIGWPTGAHAAFEVATVRSGSVEYTISGKTLNVGAGQAICVPYEVEHATTILPGTQATSVWLGPGWVADLAETLGRRPSAEPGILEGGARIGMFLELLASEAEQTDAGAEHAREALVDALLVDLFRHLPERSPAGTDPAVLAVMLRIERDYAEPLSLEDLSQTAHLSRFELSRRFRKVTGTSPYQYLIKTRVHRAAEILKSGRCPVTEAAFSVGFTDLGRFARAFKKELGVLPHALKAAHDSPILRQASHSEALGIGAILAS